MHSLDFMKYISILHLLIKHISTYDSLCLLTIWDQLCSLVTANVLSLLLFEGTYMYVRQYNKLQI